MKSLQMKLPVALLFLQLLSSYVCRATIRLYNMTGGWTIYELSDLPTEVGPLFPVSGLRGHHLVLSVEDTCSPTLPTPPYKGEVLWFAVIEYNATCFPRQIRNIQSAGYSAAILFKYDIDDENGDGTFPASAPDAVMNITNLVNERNFLEKNLSIDIPSTYVNNYTMEILAPFSGKPNITTVILRDFHDFNQFMLILLGTLCLAIIVALLLFLMVYGCYRVYRIRKSIITKWKLKFLPVHIFQKGDTYEICVICLDEYIDGARLRILSCGHAFHCKCIDPWLIKSGRECPLCKRKADLRRGRGKRSHNEKDDDVESSSDERTALLGNEAHDDDNDDDDDNPVRLPLEGQTTINAIVHSSEQQEPNGRRNYGATENIPEVVVVGGGRRPASEAPFGRTFGPHPHGREGAPSATPRPLAVIAAAQRALGPPGDESRATFYIGSATTDDGYPPAPPLMTRITSDESEDDYYDVKNEDNVV